jgi:hypothetical protein
MLTNITFKAGSSPGQPPLSIDLQPSVTIFVGPNNSGKSVALRESWTLAAVDNLPDPQVIASLQRTPITASDAAVMLESIRTPLPAGPGRAHLRLPTGEVQDFDVNDFLHNIQGPNFTSYWRHFFGKREVVFLDGASRTTLLQAQTRRDLKNPSNAFERLLMNDPKRAEFCSSCGRNRVVFRVRCVVHAKRRRLFRPYAATC